MIFSIMIFTENLSIFLGYRHVWTRIDKLEPMHSKILKFSINEQK
jgi:hypothetical protein